MIVSLPMLQKIVCAGFFTGLSSCLGIKVIVILVNCTGEGQYQNSIDFAVCIWNFHKNAGMNAEIYNTVIH
jgi:hypothetical protein